MSRKLLAVAMTAAVGVVALVFGLSDPRTVYARSVSEFLAHPIRDAPVRVQGRLVEGSLCRVLDPCEYRFRLTDPGWSSGSEAEAGASSAGSTPPLRELAVRYRSCVVPDTFASVPGLDLEVGAQGELCQTCHVFEASSIVVKCPAKYEMGRYPRSRPSVPLCRQ